MRRRSGQSCTSGITPPPALAPMRSLRAAALAASAAVAQQVSQRGDELSPPDTPLAVSRGRSHATAGSTAKKSATGHRKRRREKSASPPTLSPQIETPRKASLSEESAAGDEAVSGLSVVPFQEACRQTWQLGLRQPAAESLDAYTDLTPVQHELEGLLNSCQDNIRMATRELYFLTHGAYPNRSRVKKVRAVFEMSTAFGAPQVAAHSAKIVGHVKRAAGSDVEDDNDTDGVERPATPKSPPDNLDVWPPPSIAARFWTWARAEGIAQEPDTEFLAHFRDTFLSKYSSDTLAPLLASSSEEAKPVGSRRKSSSTTPLCSPSRSRIMSGGDSSPSACRRRRQTDDDVDSTLVVAANGRRRDSFSLQEKHTVKTEPADDEMERIRAIFAQLVDSHWADLPLDDTVVAGGDGEVSSSSSSTNEPLSIAVKHEPYMDDQPSPLDGFHHNGHYSPTHNGGAYLNGHSNGHSNNHLNGGDQNSNRKSGPPNGLKMRMRARKNGELHVVKTSNGVSHHRQHHHHHHHHHNHNAHFVDESEMKSPRLLKRQLTRRTSNSTAGDPMETASSTSLPTDPPRVLAARLVDNLVRCGAMAPSAIAFTDVLNPVPSHSQSQPSTSSGAKNDHSTDEVSRALSRAQRELAHLVPRLSHSLSVAERRLFDDTAYAELERELRVHDARLAKAGQLVMGGDGDWLSTAIAAATSSAAAPGGVATGGTSGLLSGEGQSPSNGGGGGMSTTATTALSEDADSWSLLSGVLHAQRAARRQFLASHHTPQPVYRGPAAHADWLARLRASLPAP